jgi:transposase
MTESSKERPSAAERPPESGAAALGRGGRMSRQRKRDAVLRLLRGEHLDTVSRALGVTAATLSGWREAFLDGGEANLVSTPADGEERESDRLKARLGEMLLERELLEQKIALLEGGAGPLGRRRSRR